MSAGRLKAVSLATLVLLAAGLLLAWSQAWFEVTVAGATTGVGGDIAAGALAPLGLATLALVAALAIAGPVFRVLLGSLAALLGTCVIVVVAFVVAEPELALSPVVTEQTGVSGHDSTAALIDSYSVTGWPIVATVLGALLLFAGLTIVATSRNWPGPTRRYSRTEFADDRTGDPIDEWDALSAGEDPTASTGSGATSR